jgi:hypothetical protein
LFLGTENTSAPKPQKGVGQKNNPIFGINFNLGYDPSFNCNSRRCLNSVPPSVTAVFGVESSHGRRTPAQPAHFFKSKGKETLNKAARVTASPPSIRYVLRSSV